MRRSSALIAALMASTLLSSCQVAPGTGRSSFNVLSSEDEAKMGAEAHPDVLKQFGGVYDNPKVQAYVAGIGKRLAGNTETPAAPFRFTVLNSDVVNAFALPGGYVYVSRGLMALADDEAELAGVVGHEIGHVIAKHSNERLSTQFATQQGMAVVQALGGEMTETKKMLYGALGLGAQYGVILPYGRKQESEADVIGLDLMAKAGFDPAQAVTLWERMSQANGKQPPEFLSTHPSNETRIRDLQACMNKALAVQQQARAAGAAPNCK